MTSLNLSHEYADLDEILDVDDRDDLMSGGLEPMSLNVYDESYIEDLSHLCSENSEITQQHYQAKIDIQRVSFYEIFHSLWLYAQTWIGGFDLDQL